MSELKVWTQNYLFQDFSKILEEDIYFYATFVPIRLHNKVERTIKILEITWSKNFVLTEAKFIAKQNFVRWYAK